MKISISTKTFGIAVLFSVLIGINVLVSFFHLQETKDINLLINLARQQNMLTQNISKNIFFKR